MVSPVLERCVPGPREMRPRSSRDASPVRILVGDLRRQDAQNNENRPRSPCHFGTCDGKVWDLQHKTHGPATHNPRTRKASPLSPLSTARVNLQGNVLVAPVLHGLDGLAQGLVTDTARVLGSGEMRISVSMLQIIILFVTLKDKTTNNEN